ncbi:hypothetical protein [Streptomyces sp. MS191]|uniref:hypothetical protein n=1 Tax=Streptomyces sp. ms191 TaxID=1827978 RepID=UPI00164EE633|nr:hypothetical protein [Streptomyces sp. ms191]
MRRLSGMKTVDIHSRQVAACSAVTGANAAHTFPPLAANLRHAWSTASDCA